MSISIEALAMAGVEYVEWGMDVEEWEREDSDAPPPPHLLAEEEEGDDDDADGETSGGVTLDYRSRRTGKGRSSVRVIERILDSLFAPDVEEAFAKGYNWLLKLESLFINRVADSLAKLAVTNIKEKLARIILIIMLISMEALAMAGVDYLEWGMDVEEWGMEA
ncbi:hypothetical protein JRO89_XS08G0001600 [Xanthoceras sorbifolium]|uniref:Uncharacterized protein n=1 Tax=Xanthoceras sorbifolium TaxID=99658 RepID=A0ABQ8HMZ5_9ROSI|nr:hypothetical protein JRO89_XS08G0001600 [Xanthoceras sorbifolium]